MERFNMSRNKRLINNDSTFNSKLEKENLKFGISSYKNGGFIDVTNQVEMITDSLLACLNMSKCRPLRRVSDVSTKTKTRLTSEIFTQTQKETAGDNNMHVTHMLRQDNWYRKFEEWNSIISQEVLIDSNSKNCSLKEFPGIVSQINMKSSDQADPISMVDIVQGEIQTLTSLAPSVSRTAANLSQWVSHYKECTKCHEKITLLDILHRIQELNLYIAKKRKKTHSRSTQSKEKEEKSVREIKEQASVKSSTSQQISEEESKDRQVEKSQILDPAAIAEGNPGVQILLEVDPEKTKFYPRVEKGLWEIQNLNSSTTQVNGFSYSSSVPESSKDRSADFISPKLFSVAAFFVPTFFERSPDSVLVLRNSLGVCRTVKRTLEKSQKVSFINRVYLCDKQSLRLTENFCIVFFKRIGCLSIPRTLNHRNLHSDESSVSVPHSLKKLNERMELKIVDEEVAALRNLITEVQQNQIKLSKVLLNEGIFSQPLIKLTNPNLLEEESKALKKLSEIENSTFESSSLEDLQDILNNLKEKCNFKNRLIGTVTRGLHHNIPKEWWEEIVGYTFEGSNTLNEQEYEKVDGLLRQCSSYFKRQEKALDQQAPIERLEDRRRDERPSEEADFESEEEETSRSDSDQESEYMTGLEDFPECEALELCEGKNCEKPSSTSSFVQKILYEDACAGVAVMDLFVAIKAVKVNLDALEERNNEFFEKIHHLNTETKVFMTEYEHLRYCITEFLNQMEGDINFRQVMKSGRKQEKSKETGQTMKPRDDTTSKKIKEPKCSENLPAKESKPQGAPPKENLSTGNTNLPEAMMVSFLAALVCLEKEQKRNSFLAGSGQGGKIKLEGTQRHEPHKPPEGEVFDSESHKISTVVNTNKKTSEGDAGALNSKSNSVSLQDKVENKPLKKLIATDSGSTSDDDDNFDEALSSVFLSSTTSLPSVEISSVNCMGDLKKEIMDKQNESFVFKADIDPSRVWKLATDICSKVMKTKRKKKEKVLQQHRQQGSKNTVADSLKFTVSTNSPMGVFDVTVVPHKKRRLLNKKPDSDISDTDLTSSQIFTDDSSSNTQIPAKICDPNRVLQQPPKPEVETKEGHWTHENFKYGIQSASRASFSDGETFVDAYMEQSEDDAVMKKAEKGLLQELCFFSEKPTFFEIFKCHPVYYSQCLMKKVSETRDQCQVDVSYVEKNSSDETFITLNSGEKEEKTMIIEGQTSDLVIYIQVELEDESRSNSQASVECQANSLGTQTAEIIEKESSEKSIKIEKNIKEDKSLLKIWKCVTEPEEEKKNSSDMVTLVVPEKLPAADPEILDFLEVLSEKEIKDTQPEETCVETCAHQTMSKINFLDMMAAKQKAHIWFVQKNLMPVHRGEIRMMTFPPSPMDDIFDSKGISDIDLNLKSVELEDALKLIHEIESDVVEVKLSDALSILPRLETELRKHVTEKIKNMQQTESKTGSDHKKTPEESTKDSKSEGTEGSLSSLLAILSSLEEAVKLNNSSSIKPKLCTYNSSAIFQLLHALTDSIRKVEETPTVTNMSRTVDLASRLDVAVRGEESEIKPPVEYFLPIKEPKPEEQEHIAEVISEQNLKTTRKKIFQRVEDEAAVVEDRLERDFERLDRLERENDELLMFLEAFLQKTGRRVSELGDLKDRLKNLSSSLTDVYNTLKNVITLQEEDRKKRVEAEKRIAEVKERKTEEVPPQAPLPLEQTPSSTEESSIHPPFNPEPSSRPSSIDVSTALASPSLSSPTSAVPSSTKNLSSTFKWEPIRETVSGLLEALNNLKLKAVEKKQFYMEILNNSESTTSRERNSESLRSSVSSFKQSEQLSAKIKKFKKIDGHSCYMAWTKPKGLLQDFIEGYHIYVNGKINHRVRNPERHQAVLYSVDFKHRADIQLYAITEKFPKILLATLTHQNE